MNYIRALGKVSERFLEELKGSNIAFILVIGTTDTSLIPGITVAGASPELTHYTPPADAEFLKLGKCLVIPVPPVTPDGKPTPALVSRACLLLLNIPSIVVNAGCRVRPLIPHVDLAGEPGRDIRTGNALDENVCRRILENSKMLGRELSDIFDLLIIGESIPAGTTTAMAIMVALGYDAWGKVSSASPNNPIELKVNVVKEGLRRASIDKTDDPIIAVSKVGDPVHLAVAGIAAGALENDSRVLLAGGTQMCACVAILKHLGVNLDPDMIEVGTTRWIVDDKSSDMVGLLSEIWPNYALLVAEYSMSTSKYPGLRAYDEGFVKEGVGMGGLLVTTLVRGFTPDDILRKVEEEYEKMIR